MQMPEYLGLSHAYDECRGCGSCGVCGACALCGAFVPLNLTILAVQSLLLTTISLVPTNP